MSQFPNKDAVLQWIKDNPKLTTKRDIAKAFGIKGAARIELKQMLRELQAEGHLAKRRSGFRDPSSLPPVSVLRLLEPDAQGDMFAHPVEWTGGGTPPKILFEPKKGEPALGPGNRILARLTATPGAEQDYIARLIRAIGENPLRLIGIFRKGSDAGRIVPIDKGSDKEWAVALGADGGARDGELVEAEQSGPKARMGLPNARIINRLGDPGAPKAVSLIAIHQHAIPDHFSDAAVAAADAAKPAGLKGREDLRDLALLTIDPADARDRDDAILAMPDPGADNVGGHILWVAIADVAHYVRPGSALDQDALDRGNSTYFPDRVVPMLPDTLSGDLCSLHEAVPRAVIAVEMRITSDGRKIAHRFVRGLMQSKASFSYEDVQSAMDGRVSERVAPLLDTVIKPLYAAYKALAEARAARQPLNLDLPERQIVLSDQGKVSSVAFKERLDAHRLVEEFMVLANVAAAETLVAKKVPLLFRVHEEPAKDRLEALREVADASNLNLAKGQVLKTAHLNRLLAQAAGTDQSELISMAVLRSMTQAYYSPDNLGHFGLALRDYAHFTSPIRRYSDLVVHRALITAHGWGDDGLTPEAIELLHDIGKKISATERRSMVAERDTNDRYLAAFLSDRVDTELPGRISGVTSFGIFVRLDETGADALVLLRSLGDDYYHHDAGKHQLQGDRTGRIIMPGQKVVVKLSEASPLTGGLMAELVTLEGEELPQGGGRRSFGRGGASKSHKARKGARKAKSDKHARRRAQGDKPTGDGPKKGKRNVSRVRH